MKSTLWTWTHCNTFFKEFACSFIESVLRNKNCHHWWQWWQHFQQKEGNNLWLQFLFLVKVLHGYVIIYLSTSRKKIKSFHASIFPFLDVFFFFSNTNLQREVRLLRGLLCIFVVQLGMNVSHSTLLMLGWFSCKRIGKGNSL